MKTSFVVLLAQPVRGLEFLKSSSSSPLVSDITSLMEVSQTAFSTPKAPARTRAAVSSSKEFDPNSQKGLEAQFKYGKLCRRVQGYSYGDPERTGVDMRMPDLLVHSPSFKTDRAAEKNLRNLATALPWVHDDGFGELPQEYEEESDNKHISVSGFIGLNAFRGAETGKLAKEDEQIMVEKKLYGLDGQPLMIEVPNPDDPSGQTMVQVQATQLQYRYWNYRDYAFFVRSRCELLFGAKGDAWTAEGDNYSTQVRYTEDFYSETAVTVYYVSEWMVQISGFFELMVSSARYFCDDDGTQEGSYLKLFFEWTLPNPEIPADDPRREKLGLYQKLRVAWCKPRADAVNERQMELDPDVNNLSRATKACAQTLHQTKTPADFTANKRSEMLCENARQKIADLSIADVDNGDTRMAKLAQTWRDLHLHGSHWKFWQKLLVMPVRFLYNFAEQYQDTIGNDWDNTPWHVLASVLNWADLLHPCDPNRMDPDLMDPNDSPLPGCYPRLHGVTDPDPKRQVELEMVVTCKKGSLLSYYQGRNLNTEHVQTVLKEEPVNRLAASVLFPPTIANLDEAFSFGEQPSGVMTDPNESALSAVSAASSNSVAAAVMVTDTANIDFFPEFGDDPLSPIGAVVPGKSPPAAPAVTPMSPAFGAMGMSPISPPAPGAPTQPQFIMGEYSPTSPVNSAAAAGTAIDLQETQTTVTDARDALLAEGLRPAQPLSPDDDSSKPWNLSRIRWLQMKQVELLTAHVFKEHGEDYEPRELDEHINEALAQLPDNPMTYFFARRNSLLISMGTDTAEGNRRLMGFNVPGVPDCHVNAHHFTNKPVNVLQSEARGFSPRDGIASVSPVRKNQVPKSAKAAYGHERVGGLSDSEKFKHDLKVQALKDQQAQLDRQAHDVKKGLFDVFAAAAGSPSQMSPADGQQRFSMVNGIMMAGFTPSPQGGAGGSPAFFGASPVSLASGSSPLSGQRAAARSGPLFTPSPGAQRPDGAAPSTPLRLGSGEYLMGQHASVETKNLLPGPRSASPHQPLDQRSSVRRRGRSAPRTGRGRSHSRAKADPSNERRRAKSEKIRRSSRGKSSQPRKAVMAPHTEPRKNKREGKMGQPEEPIRTAQIQQPQPQRVMPASGTADDVDKAEVVRNLFG
ncbi:unnamed protein product [Amoebophrya sp. A120]|nr:unnamed protein product [Amoebophrya sp. A120]|eukprot:GSA120T00011189001.1